MDINVIKLKTKTLPLGQPRGFLSLFNQKIKTKNRTRPIIAKKLLKSMRGIRFMLITPDSY